MTKFNYNDYLSSLNIDVMRFGLDAMKALLSEFGNPQDDYPTILVAGTNGKGSTAAMVASIMKQSGRRVGLYTSPHLVDVRERIVINGAKIPGRTLNRIVLEIKNHVTGHITYFEVLTAAAFIYFQRAHVDVAVMEVGLGGRLDATNVCRPLVSVITNIGLEHTAYLGRTLTTVAGEKAGIVKPSGICITAATQQKAVQALASVCRQKKAVLYRLGTDFKMVRRKDGLADYLGIKKRLNGLAIPLRGGHQLSNAALALAVFEIIEENGFMTDSEAIYAGLKKTRWEARMEILCDRPLFLLDGAHNPSGVRALHSALVKDFSWRRLILIFAALADKDYCAMLKKIAPLAAITVLPSLRTRRAVSPREMARVMKGLGYRTVVCESVDQAILKAMKMADDKDIICALGSFYLAGEIKQVFHQMHSCGKQHGDSVIR
ncbi:MAG: bifunctional folylpolyglutamate synthase/dihydrofolate synthase [Smithellaceae bacterium]|nr:bifunctional folylpolyglutamate synthase/dihydrofolate synthase [Smithellaceae bacterium]